MSDAPQAPVEEQDTPIAPPEEGHAPEPTEPEVDYAKRYNDLRPEYDRGQQQIAEYEALVEALSDPETQADALALIGYDPNQAGAEEKFDDPVEELRAEIESLKSERAQEQEQAQAHEQQEQLAAFVDSGLQTIEGEIGRQFDDAEVKFLAAYANANRDQNGLPDVTAAWKELDTSYTAQQKRWLETKKTHRVPDGQSAAGKQPDLSNPRERAQYFDARLSDGDE